MAKKQRLDRPGSLPKLCVSVGNTNFEELRFMHAKYPFMELRMDTMKIDHGDLVHICRHTPNIILKYKYKDPGEMFYSIFSDLLDYVNLIDLDIDESFLSFLDFIEVYSSSQLLLSTHYDGIVYEEQIWEDIEKAISYEPAYIKIVLNGINYDNANKCLYLYDEFKERYSDTSTQLITFAMGEKFKYTRLYSAIHSDFTYCMAEEFGETAPGQINYYEMQKYIDSIKSINQKKYFAVVGNPVAMSKSPKIFNYIFDRYNVNAKYIRFSFTGEREYDAICDQLKFSGLNFTAPIKSLMAKMYNAESEEINTLLFSEDFLEYKTLNTDAMALESILHEIDLENKEILILGYGDTASISVKTLLENGVRKEQISVTGRSSIKIDDFAEKYGIKALYNDFEGQFHFDIAISVVPELDHPYHYMNFMSKVKIMIEANYTYPIWHSEFEQDENLTYYSGIVWLLRQAKPMVNHALQGLNIEENEILIKNNYIDKIFFIGLPGTGKTRYGRELAAQYQKDFSDVDEEIEKEQKMSVMEIFDKKGEKYFRNLESKMLEYLIRTKKGIISLGSGIVENHANRRLIKNNGYIVWLHHTNFEAAMMLEDRPINRMDDIWELKRIYQNRLQYYFDAADLLIPILSNYGKNPNVDEINLKRIENEIHQKLIY